MGDRDNSVQFKKKSPFFPLESFHQKKENLLMQSLWKDICVSWRNNLRSHLKAPHSVLWTASLSYDEDDDTDMTIVGTKRIDSYIESDSWKVCNNARAGIIMDLLVDRIYANSCLISVVEDAGLQQLFEYMEPVYSLPSHTQVSSIVKNVMPMVINIFIGERSLLHSNNNRYVDF